MVSKLDKLKNALDRKKAQDLTQDERLRLAEEVAASIPNPFSKKPSPIEEYTPATTTFTRESPITTVVHETGNRNPYFCRVAFGLIDPNPYNARAMYKPQRIHRMASEIKADGQMVPGLATIRGDRIVLAAGHYRWKGIGVAQIGFMDVMIYEGLSDRELYKLSYKENAERTDQTALDNAKAWKKLLEDGIYDSESALAEETGISLPNVNKTLSILDLPQSVLDYLDEEENTKFALSTLYELQLYTKIAGEPAGLEMAKKIVQEDITRDQIKNARVLLETPKPPRKVKETSRQYRIMAEDGQQLIGHIKDFDSGKIFVEVNLDDDERRKQILQSLQTLFNVN